MGNIIDIKGMRFGKIVVIQYVGNAKWECVCDCGNKIIIDGHSLRRGATKSCGCYKAERIGNFARKHGQKQSRLYQIWSDIKKRCNNPNCKCYNRYGGRGIHVCPEWENHFENFEQWANANGYSDILTIDRIDNNADYTPQNCRWVNRKEQAKNRNTSIMITHNGKTQTLTDWCIELNMKYSTVYSRIYRDGWDIEEALTTPLIKRGA